MQKDVGEVWDVAVIGGGPAGMFAAITAAEKGAKVVLLEKNRTLGKKLLITGGGRCNVTNAEPDQRTLLAKYKQAGKFLASPFSRYNNNEALAYFHEQGMPTKVEAEGRVFPLANTAKAVHQVLVDALDRAGVVVRTGERVSGFRMEDSRIVAAELQSKRVLRAQTFILATGGTSHPETGSTGDGYPWLRNLGHTVREPSAALVPVATKETWVKRAAGVALRTAKIRLIQNGEKKTEARGKILFTHVGLSGPGILNLSSTIGEMLDYGECVIELDLIPDMGYEKANAALQEVFKIHHVKKVRNALSSIVPAALAPSLLSLAGIDEDKPCNSVTRDERIRLMKTMKHLRVTAKHLLGMEKAVITAGGVDIREIDFKTMRSEKCVNLFLVGDVLDIDRPSGGYSLQLCWTSGHVAGSAAAEFTRAVSQ